MIDPKSPMKLIHTHPIRIYYEDTDCAGVVYYSNYLRFAERARTEMFREIGYSNIEYTKNKGITFVVRNCDTEYLKPAFLDDLIEVDSGNFDLKRASFWISQNVRRQHDLLVTMRIRLACVDKDGQVCRIPKYLLSNMQKLQGTVSSI